jgi:hypothetical protein
MEVRPAERANGVRIPPTPGFFTIGSSKNDVLGVQGSPDSFNEQIFRYGSSTVQFRDGKVISWNNSYPALKAKLLPSTYSHLSRNFFTAGSSKDEVLAIQGSPDSFNNQIFRYGSSTVQFRDGKVISWNNSYPALKAKLLPSQSEN